MLRKQLRFANARAFHTFILQRQKNNHIKMSAFKSSMQKQLRQLHKSLAPIMVLPLLLTLLTGAIYQMFDTAGQGDTVKWLLAVHKGHFGGLRLESIYTFFNALGLLFLAVTGISMWLQRRTSSRRTTCFLLKIPLNDE